MTDLVAKARKDGKWWVFEIPELSTPSPKSARRIVAMGQAERAGDVAGAAAEVASLWLDVEPQTIAITVEWDLPGRAGATLRQARLHDAEGRELVERAAVERRQAARELLASGMTATDAATILGVSRQRVQQLVAG